MLNWKTILTLIVAAPLIALLGGAGILFYQIGQTWDARSTDSLIAGLVATCGGGAVVIGVLLAIIIGIPFAIRMFREAGQSQRGWYEGGGYPGHPSLPSSRFPQWAQGAPQIEDKQAGSWNTTGGTTYDTWEDDPSAPVIEQNGGWK